MRELLRRLRRRVYRRSLTRNIGVLEAINELRAEAGQRQQTQEVALLEQLRAEMEAYHRRRRRSR